MRLCFVALMLLGAVMPGASVVATQVDSNYRYTAQSNQSGYFTIGQLLEGEYTLPVEAPGHSRTGLRLEF